MQRSRAHGEEGLRRMGANLPFACLAMNDAYSSARIESLALFFEEVIRTESLSQLSHRKRPGAPALLRDYVIE